MREGILIVALCGAEPRAHSVVMERKFHDGMLGFVERLDVPIACLLPRLSAAETDGAIDSIEAPLEDLTYRIHYVERPVPTPDNLRTIEGLLDEAGLVILGALENFNMAIAKLCQRRGVPYVIVTEYTQKTQLQIMRATTPSLLRRAVRELRFPLGVRRAHQMVAGAAEIHANGYPTYDEFATTNPHRTLFFDTRARASDIISNAELSARLASHESARPKLIFSGRYHPIKGALDVIRVGLELDRRGFDFQLDLYGKGPLRQAMESMARGAAAAGKINIHDAVSFPELQQTTRQADLFVCCHVQGDPSCTYVETFACGVPIAGYANEMWSPLCKESGAGVVVRNGDYKAMADAIIRLLASEELSAASHRAREFASRHTMEIALDSRAARMTALIRGGANRSFAFEPRSAIT
ncbi:MAG TPA: glycosyltransferase [Candidatus Binataceae bacterium]|nr:glycosyltransferase [Candidatus Binataceae bacterium]